MRKLDVIWFILWVTLVIAITAPAIEANPPPIWKHIVGAHEALAAPIRGKLKGCFPSANPFRPHAPQYNAETVYFMQQLHNGVITTAEYKLLMVHHGTTYTQLRCSLDYLTKTT